MHNAQGVNSFGSCAIRHQPQFSVTTLKVLLDKQNSARLHQFACQRSIPFKCQSRCGACNLTKHKQSRTLPAMCAASGGRVCGSLPQHFTQARLLAGSGCDVLLW